MRSASIGFCFSAISEMFAATSVPSSRPRTSSVAVGGELGPVGQLAALQQVCGLLERRAAGQVVDVVSTIEEATGLAVDVAERCGRGDDIGQAFCGLVRHEYFLRLSPSEVYL